MKLKIAFPAFALIALLLAACATDPAAEDLVETTPTTEAATTTTEEETTTTAAETTTTAAAAEADLAAFCETAIETDLAISQGPDVEFDAASEEEIEEAMAAFGERVLPLLDELEANAPEELSEPLATVVEQLRGGLETGEDPTGDPMFIEADALVDQFIVENCDVTTVDVTGVDFAFEGVPETLEPGVTAFRFENRGQELHELVLFRINDDVEMSVEELLQLPQEEALPMVQPVAFTLAAPQGESIAFAELEPGRYGMVCFIPVGTTSFEDLPEEETGVEAPPHFTQGMFAEFEVEG